MYKLVFVVNHRDHWTLEGEGGKGGGEEGRGRGREERERVESSECTLSNLP